MDPWTHPGPCSTSTSVRNAQNALSCIHALIFTSTALHPLWLGIPTDVLPAAVVILLLTAASVALAPVLTNMALTTTAWVMADVANLNELHQN